MPLMDILGMGPASPDRNGLFGLFNDENAMRMQMAGNTIGGLSIVNQGNPQSNADQMIKMRAFQQAQKERSQLYEAAKRYADKIRPSNPELADAILAQPELIKTIHGEQIKSAMDPQAQAFRDMFSMGQPNPLISSPTTAPLATPAPTSQDDMSYVPPMDPDPMFEQGGAMSSGSGPVPTEVPQSQLVPRPGAADALLDLPGASAPAGVQDPMNEMLSKARQKLSIPDLTMEEMKRMVAAGPAGFPAVWNQIKDERNQATKEKTRLKEREEDVDFREGQEKSQREEFAASHELAKGNASRSQEHFDMSHKLQVDQFNETLKQHEAEAKRLKENAGQAQKNWETNRSDDAKKEADAAKSAANAAAASLDEHKASRAMQLRDDLWAQTKGYKTVLDVGDRALPLLEKAAEGKRLTGTDQIQIIYDLVKGLDSVSTVREGEVALTREAQSVSEAISTWIQRSNKGSIVEQALAKEMLNKVLDFAAVAEKRDYIVTQKFKNDAKKFGINPDLLITDEPVDMSGFVPRFGTSATPPGTPGESEKLVSPKF